MDSFHLTRLFGGLRSHRSSVSSWSEEPELSFSQLLSTLVDDFRSAISVEKRNLKKDRELLQGAISQFDTEMKTQWLDFQREKVHWEESQQLAETLFLPEDQIIDIDVGGQARVTASFKTLERFPESRLAEEVGKRRNWRKDRIFIDRDPAPFCALIHFLRTGKSPSGDSPVSTSSFQAELLYWGIPLQSSSPHSPFPSYEFDPEWCAPTLQLENCNQIVRKVQKAHGIVLGNQTLSAEHQNLEFQVETTDRNYKMFLGLVDRREYNPTYLTSLQWREAPSSYYWNIQSNELVKTDKTGLSQIKSGYGCFCDSENGLFGIVYDAKLRTLSFSKMGINQGTAFTGVPSGLYPALDIWFESGAVSILQPSQSPSNPSSTISPETSF